MIPLLTAPEMRSLEADAIQRWGIPSLVLQEHAALGALALLPEGEPLTVLAGPGNNGGDALALARLAKLQGRSVEVFALHPEPSWRGGAALQAKLWEGLGGGFRFAEQPDDVVPALRGWLVDGLFGLGSRLPLPDPAKAWITACRQALEAGAAFRVLALDLPSGLDPCGPDFQGPVLPAHRTACFGHLKVCHGLRPAKDACGEISVIPLPLPKPAEAALGLVERPSFAPSPWHSHKREFGHVAIRAGRSSMSGAAVLAAIGALRGGAGLVTVLADPEVRSEIAVQVPEAMVRPWTGSVPDGIDVLLVGPGGVEDIPTWDGRLVLDASSLKPGEGRRWMARPNTIITPHPGEFARLFELPRPQGVGDRLAQARSVATGPGVLVLKGAQTLVAGGGSDVVWVNLTGHPGLSTGGTGDLLAGLVAARWGRRPEAQREAAAEAVWLHGAAADLLGHGPLLVRDLGPVLSRLLREDDGRL